MRIPRLNIGKTARFPEGKIHPTDEGEIRITVGHVEGQVIVDFGTPCTWVGMPPDRALEFARVLQQHAHEALGGRTP